MKTVCPKGVTTTGIDIYHGDYIQDMDKVLASGVKYVMLKAWEYSIDASFKSRWQAMKDRKVIRGAYDFFHPQKDPTVQAINFLSTFGGSLEDDEFCCLDFEVTDGASAKTILDSAIKWLQYVENHTKKTPILYMSPGFEPLDSRFSKYPLWVANYGVKCPHVPDAHQDWSFWQTTGTGLVPGMRGVCDKDVFNGDYAALQAFVRALKIA